MKINLSFLAAAASALLLAMPLAAASGPAANTAMHATQTAAVRSVWPPETLSGTIAMVKPNQKLLVMETPSGVPYDMVITPHTRIKSGDRLIKIKDLSSDMNQPVSVTFTPERRGDVATSIPIVD
jgi:hypothetical protein